VNLSDLIDSYGYWAVFGWTFIEGESLLALAGLAAQQGWLEFPLVIAAAIAGSFLGDQIWFFLGRHQGPKFLARYPKFAPKVARAHELLERYQTPLILAVRFLYGLRAVLPFVIGMSRISTLKFQLLNFAGAVIWSATIASAGYLFGNAVEYALGDVHKYGKYVIAAVAVVFLVVWWASRRRPARRRAELLSPPDRAASATPPNRQRG
jgi:membrane protein DedA with SNARE-associated domain